MVRLASSFEWGDRVLPHRFLRRAASAAEISHSISLQRLPDGENVQTRRAIREETGQRGVECKTKVAFVTNS